MPMPVASIVWGPGAMFDGIVATRVGTPLASAVAVPSVTGCEYSVKVTVLPGWKQHAWMVICWPGAGVASLTVIASPSGGGYASCAVAVPAVTNRRAALSRR